MKTVVACIPQTEASRRRGQKRDGGPVGAEGDRPLRKAEHFAQHVGRGRQIGMVDDRDEVVEFGDLKHRHHVRFDAAQHQPALNGFDLAEQPD